MRILSVKKIKGDSMNGLPPQEADFFPAGEVYDWYNPLDAAREVAYKAAYNAWLAEQGAISALHDATASAIDTGQQVADAALKTAIKVGIGVIALKLFYDFSKTKLKGRK